jgi:hypothetical protein
MEFMTDTFSTLAFAISPLGLILAAVTWKVSAHRTKIAEEKQYAENLRNTMSDLYDVYKTEDSIKSKNQCELFATRLLDILAILTNLSHEKKLDTKILDFIKFDLEIAKSIMMWFNEKKLYEKYDVKRSEEIWSNLSKYFINSDKDTAKDYDYLKLLPQKLKIYDTLPDYL